MEYLIRSLAALTGYVTFETGEHGQAAQCAVFQAFCTECCKEIPARGPSVTFRTPSIEPALDGTPRTYLTTVHLGRCSTAVQRRIIKSMKES